MFKIILSESSVIFPIDRCAFNSCVQIFSFYFQNSVLVLGLQIAESTDYPALTKLLLLFCSTNLVWCNGCPCNSEWNFDLSYFWWQITPQSLKSKIERKVFVGEIEPSKNLNFPLFTHSSGALFWIHFGTNPCLRWC